MLIFPMEANSINMAIIPWNSIGSFEEILCYDINCVISIFDFHPFIVFLCSLPFSRDYMRNKCLTNILCLDLFSQKLYFWHF